MLRLLGLNRNNRHGISPLKSDLSHTDADEDSQSVSSSFIEDSPPPCITHTFQQKFHTDHPAGTEMENFSSFMLKAANVLTPDLNKENEGPNWWEAEEDDDDGDDSEDEAKDRFPSPTTPIKNANSSTEYTSDTDDSATEDDDTICEAEKGLLYTPNQFSERSLGDIGKATAALGVCSPAFERARIPEIAFEPHFADIDESTELKHHDEFDSSFRHFDNGSVGGSASTCSTPSKAGTCFSTVTMMSPQDFDSLEEATRKEKRQEMKKSTRTESSSLSSMVHSMDKKLFATQKADAKRCDESLKNNSISSSKRSVSSSSTCTNQDSISIEVKPKPNRFNDVRKRLASSFRSKSGRKRVTYSLSKGKSGMSKQDRLYATSLLPSKPLLSRRQQRESSSRVPRLIRQHRDRPLSILLLNPMLKIFEIVLVDFLRETTVGEALSKARVSAIDETLSEQKYTSLCNRKQEIAAPMLPVSLLVEKIEKESSSKLTETEMRRAMEARLLVAVPSGSTASDCQLIRRVLWKNPKIQRWWKKSNPFDHPDELEDDDEDDEDAIVVPPQSRGGTPATVRKSNVSRRHPSSKYEKFVEA